MKKIIFILFFFSFSSAWSGQDCLVVRHALYDVGSGSTKMTVVETNSCEKQPKVLLNLSEKIDYKEDLLKSEKSEFSEEIQEKGLQALVKLKSEAANLKATVHQGIATAAFREAQNAPQLMKRVKDQLGISIEVISQEKEAQLAYRAVQLRATEPGAMVWDIGGASFQMTFYNQDKNEWSIFKGTLASVVFKDLIIKQIKNNTKLNSPNPFSRSDLKKARKLVSEQVKTELNKSFVAKKSFNKVIGIGGVFAFSVKGHLGKNEFKAHDIDKWLEKNHNKTDEELKDKYASTVISNMILVSEMMKILKIKSVQVMDVNLVEGLLVKTDL